MTWRVFVGDWADGDRIYLDDKYDAYEHAREALAETLLVFVDDDCPDCRYYGNEALDRLRRSPAGSEFAATVDGDDYVLLRATRRGPLPDELYDDCAYA